ncbi:UNVERIFIED_CONTAM: hypothetical protein FKN15_013974 [Acipenser sinensis]
MGDVQLIVADEFSEPQLVVTDSPDSPDKALLSCISTGYPSASVQWLNESGCDITESSRTSQSLARDGLVEITSNPDRHRIVLWVVSTVVGVATVIIAISLLFKLRREASTPTDPTEQQNMPCPISMGFRGIVEMNIEKFSTQSEDIIVVSCSAIGKPGPMVTWKTSENVIEHKMEIKEDDNGIVTIISNVTVDLLAFQANKITCIASQESQKGQKLEKTISLREVRGVPFRVAIVGIYVTLLIIVTAIAIRSGRNLPVVCVARTTSLPLSSLVYGVVSERQGPREGD